MQANSQMLKNASTLELMLSERSDEGSTVDLNGLNFL
jgi:hypothetical protein